jgi:hypothetical protein
MHQRPYAGQSVKPLSTCGAVPVESAGPDSSELHRKIRLPEFDGFQGGSSAIRKLAISPATLSCSETLVWIFVSK